MATQKRQKKDKQGQALAASLRSGSISTDEAARLLEGERPAVRLSGRFPAGSKLELRERNGRRFSGGEPIVARAKSGKDSVVEFTDNVVVGRRYWVVNTGEDEVRAIAVTGKVPPAEKVRVDPPSPEESLPFQRDDPRWLSTFTQPKEQDVGEVPAGLGLSQAAVPDDVPQRSATPLGEGTPVSPGEQRPTFRQEDVPEDVPQRSSTPFGEATVIPEHEQVPGLRQEDVAGVEQMSDTPFGEATPLVGRDALEEKLIRDGAEAQMAGTDNIDPVLTTDADPVLAVETPVAEPEAVELGDVPEPVLAVEPEEGADEDARPSEDGETNPDELTGTDLTDALKDAGVTGYSNMTADEKRAALREAQAS